MAYCHWITAKLRHRETTRLSRNTASRPSLAVAKAATNSLRLRPSNRFSPPSICHSINCGIAKITVPQMALSLVCDIS